MPAKNPEEICTLFQQYMAAGDIDSLGTVYDPEVVFVNQAGELKKGWEGLKHELAPFAAAKASFQFSSKGIVQSGDTALMHTQWNISSAGQNQSVYAIEVARRQADGTWRWLIGDPFTIGRNLGTANK